MTIELSQPERELLVEFPDREISDPGPELRHTQTTACREPLRERRDRLRGLRDRFGASVEA